MLKVAEIFLVSKEGWLIMQQRDDKPGISNRGQVTAFGGQIEPQDVSPRAAAVREGQEETSLNVEENDLEDFGTTRKSKAVHGEDSIIYWFVLRNVELDDVDVQEGQGYFLIKPDDDLDKINLSIAAKDFIRQNRTRLHGLTTRQ